MNLASFSARPLSLRRAGYSWQRRRLLEWVLRYTYELERSQILVGLRGVLGLPNVTAEDELVVAKALRWYEEGLDFADALHLASSHRSERFATFDHKLAAKARRIKEVSVTTL